ncbi:uncharacterized protein SPSK_10325 [Sporothrix schenckii 1099-18]|uniref:Uncharacterized protein n=1 Tax=Sporothrix schenckii 1099-18 TaxID=1397361 RepID=A0A0F2LRA1_SPOSC|nr:uncharacterized protein SPSK_10325 [Sporothrix schenckii 1099-18]KJR80032.1 hypothetical protein SPSK_10325 [Sporothrix schenckii 1099-18]
MGTHTPFTPGLRAPVLRALFTFTYGFRQFVRSYVTNLTTRKEHWTYTGVKLSNNSTHTDLVEVRPPHCGFDGQGQERSLAQQRDTDEKKRAGARLFWLPAPETLHLSTEQTITIGRRLVQTRRKGEQHYDVIVQGGGYIEDGGTEGGVRVVHGTNHECAVLARTFSAPRRRKKAKLAQDTTRQD